MKNEDIEASRRKSRGVGGVILIIVGVCLLLQRLHLNLPYWLFSWQTILMVVGIAVGVSHNFRGIGWFIMVLVGGIFLAGDIFDWPYSSAEFIWPVVLIAVGVSVIAKRSYSTKQWKDKKANFATDFASHLGEVSASGADNDDVLNATAIFGSVDKVVMSKNFKGGDVTSIFGGTVLNFMKADIQGTAVLDVTAIFGGCEIIVPSNWKLKVDVTSILGGVDDKRYPELLTNNGPEKMLVLRGSCIFGGLEIKSYS